MRKPLFVVALAALAVVVLVEIGASIALKAPTSTGRVSQVLARADARDLVDDLDADERQEITNELGRINGREKPPGLGIPYMALVDGLLLFTAALVGASLVFPERVTSKLQGVVTLIVTIVVIILGIVLFVLALVKLLFMIGLFVSVPFGTLAYFVLFGFFDKGGAQAALSVLLLLKLVFCVCLLLAQQRFLQNKGLVLLVLTSLLANLVVGFLHGIVPGVLVSITDAIAALIMVILAVIWALVMLVFSIVSIVKVLRFDRADAK